MKFVVPAGVAYLRFICDTRYMEAYVIMKNQVLTQELYREMTGGPSPDDTPVTNLFDPASCEAGWIDGDGVHSPDASFRTSAAIPVEEGDEYLTLARRYPIRAGTSSPWTPARM